MSPLEFTECGPRPRLGLKGPRAQQWLMGQGIELPAKPNTWLSSSQDTGSADELLIARLGASEFFLEETGGGDSVRAIESALTTAPGGVYPVLREDAAFSLSGEGVHEVLAQVCNINFAAVPLASRSLIMTMMIGVAVLVIADEAVERRHRIWCDPSFGPYLGATLGMVVRENGGKFTGVST